MTGIANAKWIWTDDDPGEAHVCVYARRRFHVDRPVGAFLDITADTRYFLWVNGQPVGFGPPKFHWETPTVDHYEIATWLVAGDNVATALVYSYGAGGNISSCMPKRGALRACIGCDGKEIVTDRAWKVRRERAYASVTVRRGEVQPPAECFDARRSLGNPWRVDFDDSKWEAATELPERMPASKSVPRDIPLFGWRAHEPDRLIATGVARFPSPIDPNKMVSLAAEIAGARRIADNEGRITIERGLSGRGDLITLDASRDASSEGCYALWDFGRIWTGYPLIELNGAPGTVVDLSYAEHLRKGVVDPTKNGLNYVDRIILGEGRLTHRITWPKCLRYLQADVRGGRATIQSVALQRSAYPVQWIGRFASSDPALDQAWEISAHTVQICMEDSYMDTPWRERGSWLGDDVPKALANYYVFGDAALMRRFLRQHARGQLPSGAMQGKYPGCKSSHISTWTLTYAVSVREYIRHTGNRSLGRELWPVIRRIASWLETYRLPEGVYGNLPLEVTAETNIYNFIDWAPVDTGGANAAWNAHACHFLKAAAFIAEIAGDHSAASECNRRAMALRRNFQRLFWDETRGVFVNGWRDGKRLKRWGCHENYLAVLFGLATDRQRRAIIRRLRREDLTCVFKPDRKDYDILIPETDGNWTVAVALNKYRWDNNRMVPPGTPYFAGFVLEAMFQLGMTQEALDFIRLRWGEFSRQGGTTVWEAWNRENGSNSHGWGCGPAFLLAKYILGISPANPPDAGGLSRQSPTTAADYTIFPQRGDLTWARGRMPTPKGIIDVSWEYDDCWKMEVNLPETCRAVVGLPLTDRQQLICDEQVVNESNVEMIHGCRRLAIHLCGGPHVLTSR